MNTVISKVLVEQVPVQRLKDILDYHSAVEQAAATATRAGVDTLVLTHYVPALAAGQEEQWRALAAGEFSGRVEHGDDLLRVLVGLKPNSSFSRQPGYFNYYVQITGIAAEVDPLPVSFTHLRPHDTNQNHFS